MLENPRREGYEGWDDAANRQRLLDAAIADGADWVMFLDADERVDADDARALRALVDGVADPGCAYGFRVFRMIGDESHYDRAGLWVYRLFAPEAGQRLPDERLHLVPIPTSIPRERWVNTTVRIQHLASLTPADRRARREKYAQADPELEWQADYDSRLLGEDEVRAWTPRPAGMPLLAGGRLAGAAALDVESLDLDAPVLSAIVIAREDAATIEPTVRTVLDQEVHVPFEVIVVVSGSPETARVVRERCPGAKLVELPNPVFPGAARNAGLALARGDYVSFPGSHVELPPGSLEARVRAHEIGHAMVTGSIVNGTDTPAGWASYFLDHCSALPGRPSGELLGAPAHCSYARDALRAAGGFPRTCAPARTRSSTTSCTAAGTAPTARGRSRWCTAAAARPPSLARHHFARGRAMGRILRGDFNPARRGRRLSRLRFMLRYPAMRLRSTDVRIADSGGPLWGEYRESAGSSGSGSPRPGPAPASSCCVPSIPRRRPSGARGAQVGSPRRSRKRRVLAVVAGDLHVEADRRLSRETERR